MIKKPNKQQEKKDMMSSENIFVYAVCGPASYIESLELSLEFLEKFSKNKAIVITDSSRNKKEVKHEHVIDIKTDPALTDHQASVFLKTSLHTYLNPENKYCYIDTDVLAISDKVDEIFQQKFEFIGLCADNVSLDFYSPFACNCSCISDWENAVRLLEKASLDYDVKHMQWQQLINNPQGKELMRKIETIKKHPFKNAFSSLRFWLLYNTPFYKNITLGKYNLNKKTMQWTNSQNQVVLCPIESFTEFVAKQTGFVFNNDKKFWTRKNQKNDVTILKCNHLHQAINKYFNIKILPENWQHPNGGVFLFDKTSSEFLNQWHQFTMEIFNKPHWKTRDQGTLAACMWKHGIQNNKLLSSNFNYIIDYNKNDTSYNIDKGFSKNKSTNTDNPYLVHVCNHFNDTNWALWNDIMKIKNR